MIVQYLRAAALFGIVRRASNSVQKISQEQKLDRNGREPTSSDGVTTNIAEVAGQLMKGREQLLIRPRQDYTVLLCRAFLWKESFPLKQNHRRAFMAVTNGARWVSPC